MYEATGNRFWVFNVIFCGNSNKFNDIKKPGLTHPAQQEK